MIEAAVLLPLYRGRDGDVRLVLVRRAEGGVHGGELAFPGGKRERSDDSLQHTALRETEEEIGLSAGRVTVLGRLPVVETRSTGFRITPFVARIVPPRRWWPDRREVAEVLEVPLREFRRPDNLGVDRVRLPGWREAQEFEYYRLGRDRLWGASYRILQQLLPSLTANQWDV